MASPPISRMILGHGPAHFVWCICPHELLDQGRSRFDCPVHEDLEIQNVRGIDVEQATQEQLGV